MPCDRYRLVSPHEQGICVYYVVLFIRGYPRLVHTTTTHKGPHEVNDYEAHMRQLIADLSPLEMQWDSYDWGRFDLDGIQHVRRDGSVIVITDESSVGAPSWLVGYYTAAQHADTTTHESARYVYCDSVEAVMLEIITEGQTRDSGSPWRLDGESDAAFAERSLRLGTIQP